MLIASMCAWGIYKLFEGVCVGIISCLNVQCVPFSLSLTQTLC